MLVLGVKTTNKKCLKSSEKNKDEEKRGSYRKKSLFREKKKLLGFLVVLKELLVTIKAIECVINAVELFLNAYFNMCTTSNMNGTQIRRTVDQFNLWIHLAFLISLS